MKRLKQIAALLMASIMIVSYMPVYAFASSEAEAQGELSDETVITSDNESIEDVVDENDPVTTPDTPEIPVTEEPGEETTYPITLYSDYIYTEDADDPLFSYEGTLEDGEVVRAYFDIEAYEPEYSYESDIEVCGYNQNGELIDKMYCGHGGWAWMVYDKKELGTDGFKFELTNLADETGYTVHCVIKKYKGFCETASYPNTLNIKSKRGKDIKATTICEPAGSLAQPYKYKSLNTKIATVDKHGHITPKLNGTCCILVTMLGGAQAKYKVRISNLKPALNYKKVSLYKGKTEKLKLYYNSKKIKWSTSNKKVATVSKAGKITAKGYGKCTITAKVGKKTYKCTVSVVHRWPNFGAYLRSYNTRGNYFTVKFHNSGSKALTITSGIKVIDIDYKSYDRYVKIPKKITIKPKSSKIVKFYVKGRNTWPEYDDFTLYYKFKYDGKTYEGHVWDGDSVFKRGKKWYSTYWDNEWYYYFNPTADEDIYDEEDWDDEDYDDDYDEDWDDEDYDDEDWDYDDDEYYDDEEDWDYDALTAKTVR